MKKDQEETDKKNKKPQKDKKSKNSFFSDERVRFISGILISGFALYLLLACVSFIIWYKTDLSQPDSEVISGADVLVRNWGGKSGHFLAKMIIGFGFGFGAFFIPAIFGAIGLYLLKFPGIRLFSITVKLATAAILVSLILAFIFAPGLSGSGYLQPWLRSSEKTLHPQPVKQALKQQGMQKRLALTRERMKQMKMIHSSSSCATIQIQAKGMTMKTAAITRQQR
ncbi:MAG: DNA translocase FtsK 4TM domain-containing protein [Bacteroidales bacterium]|nr:DNA translocase FtsK 4TM domain-containing protein [Bacteroidales bacterium]